VPGISWPRSAAGRRPRPRPPWRERAGWLDLAWLGLWVTGLAVILFFEHWVFRHWAAMPVHLITIGLAALAWVVMWHARRRHAADAERARASQENARMLSAQVRFLQDASHQLRTPITIALGHAELLARSVTGRTEKHDIRVVVGELNRLRQLSERLLVIAAAEHPELVRREAVAVDQLAAEALRRWRPAARRRWQAGRLDPVTIDGDDERLRLALDALLENAVQHTATGDLIRICAESQPGAGRVAVSVEDSGTGIAADELAFIFDRFRTGSGPGRRAGTGLGLALVQAVARGHGGDVRAVSTPGQGTRLTLLLPARPPGLVPAGPVPRAEDAVPGTAPDDNGPDDAGPADAGRQGAGRLDAAPAVGGRCR
jgi:signal transduction histidine kinase